MVDIVDRATRSRMMSGIRGKNTRPEILIRKGLHALGFRYRLHGRCLPGKPDIVLPKYKAVILVHGCFWHGHNCPLFRWPSSNVNFWKAKIKRNQEVDGATRSSLEKSGWRILTVWECALKGSARLPLEHVIDKTAAWLKGRSARREIAGRKRTGKKRG